MKMEELIKKKVEEWTGKEVRCVDIYCGDVGVHEYVAILDDGSLYDGAMVCGAILEGRVIEGDEAREYINERAYLSLILELVMQECYDYEKDVIHAKGLGVFEDALNILERKGVVERVDRETAKLTEYGKMITSGYILDLVK